MYFYRVFEIYSNVWHALAYTLLPSNALQRSPHECTQEALHVAHTGDTSLVHTILHTLQAHSLHSSYEHTREMSFT